MSKRKIIKREKRKLPAKNKFRCGKNVFGNYQKVTDLPIIKITNNRLDIKLGLLTQKEINVVLTKIKSRKTACFDEIPPKI